MSTIRPEFHSNLVSLAIDDLLFQRSNFFYFLGKLHPWPNEPISNPNPENTVADDVIIRDNMLYLRRVGSNEVSIVTKRHTWESGAVYTQWDHTQLMQNEPFYVVTSAFAVYKCLSNNNGAPSTVEPSGTSVNPFETADGYLWKYMYSVPAFKRRKFLSGDYLPVQKALTDGFYSRGAVEQVVVDDQGSGYDDITQVVLTVVGDGNGAVLVPVISATTGEFLDVIIEDGGSGYTSATISITSLTGSGIYGNPSAVLKPIVYNGEVIKVTIEDPGQNYPADLSTTILVQGDGEGAQFTPVVVNGQVVDVIVENPGLNYSNITLTVVGAGEGAQVTGVISVSDFLSDQSVVEQSAVPGAIYAVKVTAAGDNYTENSTVTIEGDGTGATASLILNEEGGVEKVVMDTYGSGYTYANVVITDPNRLLPNDYNNASAYAILPPIDGHGHDAVKELYGDTMAIYSLIQDDDELNLIGQDYRQYGVLVNPTNLFDNKKITTQINFITFTVTVDNVTNIDPDDILVADSVQYRVVDVSDLQVRLQQLSSIYKPISVGDLLVNTNSPSNQYAVVTVDSVPQVNKYSGNLLYSSNSTPFQPADERLISVRTFIKL